MSGYDRIVEWLAQSGEAQSDALRKVARSIAPIAHSPGADMIAALRSVQFGEDSAVAPSTFSERFAKERDRYNADAWNPSPSEYAEQMAPGMSGALVVAPEVMAMRREALNASLRKMQDADIGWKNNVGPAREANADLVRFRKSFDAKGPEEFQYGARTPGPLYGHAEMSTTVEPGVRADPKFLEDKALSAHADMRIKALRDTRDRLAQYKRAAIEQEAEWAATKAREAEANAEALRTPESDIIVRDGIRYRKIRNGAGKTIMLDELPK